jgi:hypothetical protein
MRDFHNAARLRNAADSLSGIRFDLDKLASDGVVECFTLTADAESGAI